MREGTITRNVAALAKPPKLPHRERQVLTAEQVRALIEGTKDDRHGPLWHVSVPFTIRVTAGALKPAVSR